MRLRALLGFVTAASLVAAAPATAAPRFAAPTGSGLACTAMAPCPIETAVNAAAPGDDVTLLAGSFATSTALIPPVNVKVHGTAGSQPIVNTTADVGFNLFN